MFKMYDFEISVLTQTVPLTDVDPKFCISAAFATTEISVNEIGGNKELGILVLASKPATPLGALTRFRFILFTNAAFVKNEIGLLASLVLSTLPKLRLALSMTTSPVSVFTEVTAPLLLDKFGLLIKSL